MQTRCCREWACRGWRWLGDKVVVVALFVPIWALLSRTSTAEPHCLTRKEDKEREQRKGKNGSMIYSLKDITSLSARAVCCCCSLLSLRPSRNSSHA